MKNLYESGIIPAAGDTQMAKTQCLLSDQSTGMIDVSSLGNNVDGRVTVLKDSIKNYN